MSKTRQKRCTEFALCASELVRYRSYDYEYDNEFDDTLAISLVVDALARETRKHKGHHGSANDFLCACVSELIRRSDNPGSELDESHISMSID